MRKFAMAIAIGLLASAGSFGLPAPKATAATPQLKVVIVVGPVEGLTSSYRADANAAAAEFLKFTSNVVKVYSPNATWPAVAAAAAGAAVLVYLGHGNGYPNPYNSKLYTDRDNGMGLNYSSGPYARSDSYHTYFGADYVSQLNLAPNAVVILNHLCYASGDSEPGKGKPTLAVAKTRVDGFAAGFIRAGAQAVIAEGMNGLNSYIDGIFTPHLSLDSIWKNFSGSHGNYSQWSSSQSPGYLSQIDPDINHPQSDGDIYYRSMVSLPGFMSDTVGVGITYSPTTYTAITPVRVLDTRSGIGSSGKIAANTPRTFQVTGGSIPSAATAVTGNVTVTGQSKSGALAIGPTATYYPRTSTINFAYGDALANGVTVALSSTGTLSATYMVSSGNTTDLVFDVTGYFTTNTSSGDTYHPLTPARIVDSRIGVGLTTGKLAANTPAAFNVWLKGGVLSGAKAVTGNVTVANPTAAGAVYVGPQGLVSPETSTINFKAGQAIANNLTVALSPTGTLSATYIASDGNTTDLIFDVTGYYTADLTGSVYVPLTPVRLVDSRLAYGLSSKVGAGTPRGFQVTGLGGIPSGATAVSANATVVNETARGAIFVGPTEIANPPTSTLNFGRGEIRVNGLTVPTGSTGGLAVTYLAAAGGTTDFVFDVTGYFQTSAP